MTEQWDKPPGQGPGQPQTDANPAAADAGAKPQPKGILDAFLQHQQALRNYISRFVVSAHEIDDVSQEAFLRAYKAEQKTTIDQPKAFLFRVAKNMMLSEFSNKSRKMIDYVEDFEQARQAQLGSSLEDEVVASQKIGLYCEAIAALPPRCRQVILMKKVYGMSHKEIARRMDITISAVEKHLIKGGKKCAEIMDSHTDKGSNHRPPPADTQPPLALVANRRKD